MSTKSGVRFVAILAAMSALAGTPPARANPFDIETLTAAEFARLPEYCLDSQGFIGRLGRPAEGRLKWLAILGGTFEHIHHYCYGLLKSMRAETVTSKQVRSSLLASALQECDYVLRRAPHGFLLSPEILLRMGQYSAALEKDHDALEYFARSRNLKRDYWPAYLEAAKVETRLRRHERAKLLIDEGLRESPDQPALLEARQRIVDR